MNPPHASAALAHQFDDLEQQHHAGELGMWLFLATEVLFFGGLFLTYGIYRLRYEAAFIAGSDELNVVLGAVNTAVLLCSSLTMALAVESSEAGRQKQSAWLLAMTIVLGTAFLGVKGYEYDTKFEHGLVPIAGLPFEYHGPADAQHVKMFLTLYFVMTGLHALHMVVGLGILGILLVCIVRGRFLAEQAAPIHIAGLYWHFVDLIWVFLFPLLYLIGVHPR